MTRRGISECRLQPLTQQARDAVVGVLENRSLAELAPNGPAGHHSASGAVRQGDQGQGGRHALRRHEQRGIPWAR
jgi:hypothetical protein